MKKTYLFDDNQFVGYISLVRPSDVRIHFPNSKLMQKFQYDGQTFDGGVVGSYVIIEGGQQAYLARIYEASLPEKERMFLSETAFREHTELHPSAFADIQLVIDMYDNQSVRRGVGSFAEVGSKVYACPPNLLRELLANQNLLDDDTPNLEVASLPTETDHSIGLSPNVLFGRHCAIVGTTGGGKSYTVAKLIEGLVETGYKTKMIVLDATGEYKFPKEQSIDVDFMDKDILDYRSLSIADFVALFKPAGQSQLPSLDEAIRSLKLIANPDCLTILETGGLVSSPGDGKKYLQKSGKEKAPYQQCLSRHAQAIDAIGAPFDIQALPKQLVSEAVYDTDFNSVTKWGGNNGKAYDSNSSLGLRIRVRLNTNSWNSIFGFDYYNLAEPERNKLRDFSKTLEEFLLSDKSVMRIRLDNIPVQENLHAVVVNRIGNILLERSNANEDFKKSPVLVFLDEAHRFLNVTIKDEYAIETKLDAFERIAKECRKRGLFLAIATQRPRDIPSGVLSQMGTFIVHRLINESDKLAVANAASEGSQRSLAFVPTLSSGEALVLSVDLAAPVIVKINTVHKDWRPDSDTPKFKL
ncbi:MAG TPA: ATP-binding protein [Patescibacteria group bacterium]|nr:ATP-binding protein [Patescibacteria group bacterium]